MNQVSRAEARSLGMKRFFSGNPCPKGHNSERLTSNGTCIECSKQRLADWYKRKSCEKRGGRPTPGEIRQNAINNGGNRYMTGAACVHGHIDERRTSDSRCMTCVKEKNSKRAKSNPEYMKKFIRLWRVKNPEKFRAYSANRRSAIKSSGSHTGEDIKKILQSQKFRCACCWLDIKEKYHIDHIMPLALGGSNRRENLQALCPGCNLRKSAKDPIKWANERGMLL